MQVKKSIFISKRLLRIPFIVSLLIFAFVTSIAVGGVGNFLNARLPSKLNIIGNFIYLDPELISAILSDELKTPFLDTRLDHVVKIVTSHPWVFKASARRIWPDTLEVNIVEREPLAKFNSYKLLGSDGVLFDLGNHQFSGLPELYGPPKAVHAVWQHYQVFQRRFEGVNRLIKSTTLGDDLGWLIVLENGLEIRLGRTNLLTRLSRVEEVLNGSAKIEISKIKKIDARYVNGVAIEWAKKS